MNKINNKFFGFIIGSIIMLIILNFFSNIIILWINYGILLPQPNKTVTLFEFSGKFGNEFKIWEYNRKKQKRL